MLIPKKDLRQCLQVTELMRYGDLIEIGCLMDCQNCGFYRPVAWERRMRIRMEDWSYKTVKGRKIAYLKIDRKETENEPSDTDGSVG